MRLALIVLAITSSTAFAEVRVEAHLGGGLEGGLMSAALRPDGVAETGVRVSALLPGRSWGFGLSAERIGRLTPRTGMHDESKYDATIVWARTDAWIAVGVGVRTLHYDHDATSDLVNGYDFIHMAGAKSFASWESAHHTRISIDGYVAWTFGLYLDTVHGEAVGDMAPPEKDVGGMTTAYTLGFATSVTWR
jgi:hypothetical protein